MIGRLLRRSRPHAGPYRFRPHGPRRNRPYSTTPPPPPPPRQPSSKTHRVLDRILSRLPVRLQPYAADLRAAPVSHVAAFLVLHEVTAIVPLVAFFAVLHWGAERLPLDEWIGRAGKLGEWVEEGKVRGERFLRRRGWLKEDEKEAMRDERPEIEAGRPDGKGLSEKQVRIIMELAVAYAINKAIMPLRILVSLRLVPPFIALARRLRMIGR